MAITHTERLCLRPLAPTDAPRVAKLCGDLKVSQWLSQVPHPYTLQDAESFLAMVGAGDDLVWALVPEGHAELAGVIGLASEADGWHLGYWLGRPFWRQGWMSEAAHAITDHAFSTGAQALISGVFEGNDASLNIQRNLGFRITGENRLYCRALDTDRRHIDTRLDRADWETAS
ncbi:MAG: GNAT family N-acetyltransferase [Pseudomonadota bacterium]